MEIQLEVSGQKVTAELALPPGGKGPGVLVLHAWWGLNPFFKALCGRLAQQGFVALAPDLNNGEVAKTVAEATELMQRREEGQFMKDIVMTAMEFILAHPACSSQKLGVVGFSMGADWSLIAAAQAPDQVAAVVLFYGGFVTDFSKMRARLLGHFSDVDEWVPIEQIREVEAATRAAGLEVNFHVYPGKAHWFMETDRPEYDPASADLAWQRSFAFLKENVR